MDSTFAQSLVISIPRWVDEILAGFAGPLESLEERMGLAIALAQNNVARGGGPFGAAVFLGARLVGVGVNRVLDSGFSIAHAEIVSLMAAQHTLAAERVKMGRFSLVTSTEPCCQCFGAIVWSGIEELVCGAITEDAEEIGFDEGPKPEGWAAILERRGITVVQRVRRDEARSVLADYRGRGGTIYGMRHPSVG